MPHEIVLFGASVITTTVIATLAAVLLQRWRQRPLPSFSPLIPAATRLKRLLPW
jgi:hypothetical protein